MKTLFLVVAFIAIAGVVRADLLPPQLETTVTGPEASKIASLMIVSTDRQATYAQGQAKISCVKKNRDRNFTCVVKVARDGQE